MTIRHHEAFRDLGIAETHVHRVYAGIIAISDRRDIDPLTVEMVAKPSCVVVAYGPNKDMVVQEHRSRARDADIPPAESPAKLQHQIIAETILHGPAEGVGLKIIVTMT